MSSDKAGKAIGAIPIIGALMLAIGYTVVLGWIFKYAFLSITGGLYSLGTDMGAIGGTFGVTAPEAETLGEAPQGNGVGRLLRHRQRRMADHRSGRFSRNHGNGHRRRH